MEISLSVEKFLSLLKQEWECGNQNSPGWHHTTPEETAEFILNLIKEDTEFTTTKRLKSLIKDNLTKHVQDIRE